ncbi:MAG: hypothetical protein PHX40_00055 [Bacilli bacterium]|nr:hypothetical protein [Bacilli bacterium]
MKKFLFAIVISFILIPLSVNAEECTDEMVASYLPQANNVYMNYEVTSNPDTYKVYVYGLSTGLSYDGINGTRYSDGYYAFVSSGDTLSITIKISDGSVCALRDIKTLSITIPSSTTVTEPAVEEKPSTSNDSTQTNDTPTSNYNSSSGSSSSSSSSNDTSTSSNDDSASTNSTSDTKSEEVVDENNDEVTNTEDTIDEIITTTSNDKGESNKNNSTVKIISIVVSILIIVSIGIYIYIKKFRRHKK